MAKCTQCGKKIGFLATSYGDGSGNIFCNSDCKKKFYESKKNFDILDDDEKWKCENCGKEYSTKAECLKHEKSCGKDEKKFYKGITDKGITVKEFKCVCNQCKHVWFYLEEDEKKLKQQSSANALAGCGGACCGPIGMFFSNKSQDTQKEIAKMKKCPKCNSADITKTAHYYDKKS